MNAIKCPKCNTEFEMDESTYSSIKIQIRDKEFNQEVERRTTETIKAKEKTLELEFEKK